MPYNALDPQQIRVMPLSERKSKSSVHAIMVDPDAAPAPNPILEKQANAIAAKIKHAQDNNASVMMAFGAHLIKNGASLLVIRLLEEGWITHLATQGAGSIHDWELAFLGKTEEDVRANVATGTFGCWKETGKYINLAVLAGAVQNMGYGESVGRMILDGSLDLPDTADLEAEIRTADIANDPLFPAKAELLRTMIMFNLTGGALNIPHPFAEYSIFANATRLHIPITVHPGIAYDIIYNNPWANGAALGRGSHMDYGIFVNSVKNLSNGVFMSIGSAIMAPQVFEKAMAFANNLLLRNNAHIHNHHIVINDLQESTWDWSQGEPPKESPDYYLRFLKSFYRMGATVDYIAADNRALLHHLYHRLRN